MKNLAIVTWKMVLGGTEKSLISLLETIPKDEYSTTLIIMDEGGELLKEVPRHIKVEVLHKPENLSFYQIRQNLKTGKLLNAFKIGWYSFLSAKSKNKIEWEKNHSKVLPKSHTSYDLAIAFHIPTSFPVLYVINNLNAKLKVAWIHNDVEYEKEIQKYKEYYLKFDKVFCVSKQSRGKFINLFPELIEKTDVFYNIMNTSKILESAKKENVYIDEFSGHRILTIGRLDECKGFQLIPPMLKRLINEGHIVRWYCVGEGPYRKEIEKLIKEYDIENHMVLVGARVNPYPYIKDCDIYVQPSRNEAYCNTLTEAKLFYKPIITTNFSGANEQIKNQVTGVIVKYDVDEIYEALKGLIIDEKLRTQISDNLKNDQMLNETEINKLLGEIV